MKVFAGDSSVIRLLCWKLMLLVVGALIPLATARAQLGM